MRYFKLTDDVEIPGRWHLGLITLQNGSEVSLVSGPAADAASSTARLSRPGKPLDFCLSSFAVPVVRRGLADAIKAVAPDDVQRLPVEIPGHAGFEVLITLRVIKCLDEHLSEFTKWTVNDHRADLAGQYRMVTRLRVRPEAIPATVNLFRIEGWLIGLIVSEPIKRAMEASGCIGARFVEVG